MAGFIQEPTLSLEERFRQVSELLATGAMRLSQQSKDRIDSTINDTNSDDADVSTNDKAAA